MKECLAKLKLESMKEFLPKYKLDVGRGGAVVESMTFKRRVVGPNPAVAAT